MAISTSERDAIRKQYAATPGIGHHVERLLTERANIQDLNYAASEVDGIDAQLRNLGHEPPARDHETAAARRRAAAAKPDPDAPAKASPAAEGDDGNTKAAAAAAPASHPKPSAPPAGRRGRPTDKT